MILRIRIIQMMEWYVILYKILTILTVKDKFHLYFVSHVIWKRYLYDCIIKRGTGFHNSLEQKETSEPRKKFLCTQAAINYANLPE